MQQPNHLRAIRFWLAVVIAGLVPQWSDRSATASGRPQRSQLLERKL
jgi:hypothetical protein